MGSLSATVQGLFPRRGLRFRSLIRSIVQRSRGLSTKRVEGFIASRFFCILGIGGPILTSVVFLILVTTIFSGFSRIFRGYRVSRATFFLMCLSIVAINVQGFRTTTTRMRRKLRGLVLFVQMLYPICFIYVTITIKDVSTVTFCGLTLFLVFLIRLIVLG